MLNEDDNNICVLSKDDSNVCVLSKDDSNLCVLSKDDSNVCVISEDDSNVCVISQDDLEGCAHLACPGVAAGPSARAHATPTCGGLAEDDRAAGFSDEVYSAEC